MTDLSKYGHDFDVEVEGGGSKIEPGRYNMAFVGDELITGANGWEAIKLTFEVEGTTINVGYACTMAHNTSDKAVSIGIESLRKIANSCGVVGALTDPEKQLIGKSLSAELIVGERGYLEIKSDFGNTFQPAEKSKPTYSEQMQEELEPITKKASKDEPELEELDDDIPF
tara:strand:+ start:75 stop:584 length:510 start_codon:yes stop_codon:yes gene_type:complete